MRAHAMLFAVVAALSVAACSAILGFEPLTLDTGSSDSGDAAVTFDAPDLVPAPDASTPDAAEAGCGDTTSSPDNCGTCGRSCLGGTCSNGVCQPVQLASALTGPQGIAVSGDNVYVAVTNEDRIVRLSKQGDGGVVTAATLQSGSFPYAIAADDAGIFWTDDVSPGGEIDMCPTPGCGASGATPLFTGADDPQGIVVSGSTVYWVEGVGGVVRSISRKGNDGGAQTLNGDAGGQPVHLVVDSSYVYYTDAKTVAIQRVPIGGGAVKAMVPLSAVAFGIALGTSNLFWTINSEGDTNGLVQTAPVAGADAGAVLATNQLDPLEIAADDKNVYWVTLGDPTAAAPPSGGVLTCPIAGCPPSGPITIVGNQARPTHIAIDAQAIYWTCVGVSASDGTPQADGTVMKIAKPR
jgi:hypothetical protein